MSSKGNGDDVHRALLRGIEIAVALHSKEHEGRLLGHLSAFLIRVGDFRGAVEVAERSVAATRVGDVAESSRAAWVLALSHHLCGDQRLAEERCETGPSSHPQALATLARTLCLRGHTARALAAAREVVREAASMKRPFPQNSALILCEAVFIWLGEWGEAECVIDALEANVERYSLASQRGAATALRGEFLVKTGRSREGCGLLQRAAAMQAVERNASLMSVYTAALAEGLADSGAFEAALETIDTALDLAQRRGGTFDQPELLRVKGTLLGSRRTRECFADEMLSHAVDLARKQGALTWELRAMTALVRERAKHGRLSELRELEAVYAKLVDGVQTPDVCAARELLRNVRAPVLETTVVLPQASPLMLLEARPETTSQLTRRR
jgi:tetratricopeptide (TPR) repeat protein